MKKLYLLFAFLFALIGYQDAGAWNWNGSSPFASNFKLCGEGMDGIDWDDSNPESTWDGTQYSWTVKATGNIITFGFRADGTWLGASGSSLSLDTWSGNMKDGNSGSNQTVSVTKDKEYVIVVQKCGDDEWTAQCMISEKSTSVDDITSASVIGYVSSTTLNNSSQSWSSTSLSLTGTSGTWSRNFYVNSADNKNFFRLKINGKEYGHTGTSTNAVTLTDNSWTSVAEQSNDYCFAVSDTSKEYTISIRKKSDGSCYEVMASPVEEAETISTVHFKSSNGTSYQLDATGGNYSHAINPSLTADYWFEVVTSKGTRSYYYVTDGPVDTNNKQYTVAKGTSSSNNFKFDSDKVEAVTQVIANVSGLAITTAQFAITPKTTKVLKLNVLGTSGIVATYDMTGSGDSYTATFELSGDGALCIDDETDSSNKLHYSYDNGGENGTTDKFTGSPVSNVLFYQYDNHVTALANNYKYSLPGKWSVTVTWVPSTLRFSISGTQTEAPAATDVYLMKGGSEFCKLTYLDNCHYSANFPTVENKTIDLTASYAIKVVKGSDVTTYHLSGTTSVGQLEHNYGLVTGGSAFSFDTDAIAEVKSVIVHLTSATDATNAPCVKFAGEAVSNVKVYLHSSNNDYEMTKDGDSYKLTDASITLGASTSYCIKVVDGSSTTYYGPTDGSGYHIGQSVNVSLSANSNNFCFPVTTDNSGVTKFDAGKNVNVTVAWDGSKPTSIEAANVTGNTPVGGSNWVVAGTWNNFSKTASPMTDEGNGVYTLTLTLKGSGVMFLYNTSTSKQWSDRDTDFDGTAVKDRTLYQYTNETNEPKDNITYSSLKSGEYKITWNSSTSKFSIASTAAEPQIVVNMPLKKSDFANGKKHYFVVGTRMGAWRLQPEWELKANDDGTYSLPNRLMYAGYFMIAEVDSYDNYTKHIYKAYSNTSLSENYMTGSHASVNLSQVNPDNQATSLGNQYWTSYRYGSDDGDTRKQFGDGNSNIRNKTIRFIGSDGKEPNNEDNMWHCAPNLVDIKVSMSNGHPSKVEFSYNNNNNAVNEALTFTIAGSAFRNFELDPENTDYTTPRLASGDINELGWQEGWIQFDANAEPYVDAYGEFLYQTVWQKSWLNTHPTRFVNKRGFEFSGDNLTFTYDADRTAKRTSNTFSNAIDYTTSGQSKTTVTINNKMCYVTEDVWIRGAFKIWTGWGGSSVDGQGNGSTSNAALWFDRNGGHAVGDHDRVVYGTPDNNMQYFKTHNNVGAADFAIGVEHNNGVATGVANDGGTTGNLGDDDGTLVFLKRIELWWDPANGFDNSVLYFEKELGAPVIRIDRMSKTTLGYSYRIQDANADDIVAEAKIELLKVTTDAEGNETRTVAGTVRTWNEQIPATEFYNYLDEESYQEWDNELEPGDYRMRISVRYNGQDEFKTNISNKSTIREYVNPVALKLSQPKDAQGRLTFNLKIDSEALNIALANGEEAPASISYYSVTVPQYIDGNKEYDFTDFYSIVCEDNTQKFDEEITFDVDVTENKETKTVTVTSLDYDNEAGTATINVKPFGRDKKYRMPSITLPNVLPGMEHLVSVKMYGLDGDDQPWEDIFVSEGSASLALVAPAVEADAARVTLEQEEIDWDEHFDEVPDIHARQNVRHGHVYEHQGDGDESESTGKVATFYGGLAYGKDLTNANYINANLNLQALNVADEVLENWNVYVDFNVVRLAAGGSETRAAESYRYKVPAGSVINVDNGKNSVDISYLPLNIEQAKVADLYEDEQKRKIVNGSNADLNDDPTYDKPLSTTYRVELSTTFERKNEAAPEVTVNGNEQNVVLYDSESADNAHGLIAYPAKFAGQHGVQLHQRSASKWYDAFNVVNVGDLNTPHVSVNNGAPVHAFGFFITNGTVPQWYDESDPQHKMYPGGHVLNTASSKANGYADKYRVLPELPGAAHFGEQVAAMDQDAAFPVLIGNIANLTKPRHEGAWSHIKADVGFSGNPSEDTKESCTAMTAKIEAIEGYLFTSYPLLQTAKNNGTVYAQVMVTDGENKNKATLTPDAPRAVKARGNRSAASRAANPADPALLTLELPAAIGNGGGVTTEVEGLMADAAAGDLRVFPNPAVDVVTVSASSMIGKVEIVSVDGALVKTAEIDDTTGKLDVSDVAKGLYLVRTAAGTVRLIVK